MTKLAVLASILFAPTVVLADPAPRTITAAVELHAADGKTVDTLTVVTIDRQCGEAKLRDASRSLHVQLCHRDDTTAGRVLHLTWSVLAGPRVEEHDAWAVVPAAGTLELGAKPGSSLTVTLK